MIKTYKLIKDINLTTPVRLGNSIVMISFVGGSRNTGEDIRRGWFTTGDEALQQALEADSGYGRVFRCITPVPKAKPEKPAEMKSAEATEGSPDASGADSSAETVSPEAVSGVTNKQQAIEWLAANRGIDGLKPTCRAEAVRNAAALHGVSFPDWK